MDLDVRAIRSSAANALHEGCTKVAASAHRRETSLVAGLQSLLVSKECLRPSTAVCVSLCVCVSVADHTSGEFRQAAT